MQEMALLRMLHFVMVALITAVVLSSCSFLPLPGIVYDDDGQQGDARMQQIAAAVNSHDVAALKALFSTRALEQATDLDQRLDYFLSFFPNGGLTWERDAVGSDVDVDSSGNKTELLRAFYKVSAAGKDYWVYFADFTVNDAIDPKNVGLYALGATPWTAERRSGASKPFFFWATAIQMEKNGDDGYPGVYIPKTE